MMRKQKSLQFNLNDAEKEKETYSFLTTVRSWHRYVTLSQYETITAAATDSLDTLKLALGYIWLALGVHITGAAPSKKCNGKRHQTQLKRPYLPVDIPTEVRFFVCIGK